MKKQIMAKKANRWRKNIYITLWLFVKSQKNSSEQNYLEIVIFLLLKVPLKKNTERPVTKIRKRATCFINITQIFYRAPCWQA